MYRKRCVVTALLCLLVCALHPEPVEGAARVHVGRGDSCRRPLSPGISARNQPPVFRDFGSALAPAAADHPSAAVSPLIPALSESRNVALRFGIRLTSTWKIGRALIHFGDSRRGGAPKSRNTQTPRQRPLHRPGHGDRYVLRCLFSGVERCVVSLLWPFSRRRLPCTGSPVCVSRQRELAIGLNIAVYRSSSEPRRDGLQ
mgnify:CR=1 FL=1